MSYALEELRYDIIELFDDAAQMSFHRVNFGELPTRIRNRRSGITRPHQSDEAQRARRRETDKRTRAASRALRIAERAMWRLKPTPALSSVGLDGRTSGRSKRIAKRGTISSPFSSNGSLVKRA